jgi:hypothetical protein
LLQNFLPTFRFDGYYKFIIIFLDLVFEFDTKLDVWVVKASWGARSFIRLVIRAPSDKGEASFLIDLELNSSNPWGTVVSLLVVKCPVVNLKARHCNKTHKHHNREKLSPILYCKAILVNLKVWTKYSYEQGRQPEERLAVPHIRDLS